MAFRRRSLVYLMHRRYRSQQVEWETGGVGGFPALDHVCYPADYTYIWSMATRNSPKTKLTLSVRRKYVAMLRKAGARRGRSVSDLVEELAETLDKQQDTSEELSDFVKRFTGLLADVPKTAWTADDRMGELLRKHAPRPQ